MTVTQRPSGPETLVVEADFPAVTPAQLFEYWTLPALLQQWWPQVAELQPHLGGSYHLSWPTMTWHLRGRYLTYDVGKRLAFTWKWDHDLPTEPERTVTIDFVPLSDGGAAGTGGAGGTQLRLTQGPYAATPEDQEIRLEHHLTGWLHFLPRLQAAIATT